MKGKLSNFRGCMMQNIKTISVALYLLVFNSMSIKKFADATSTSEKYFIRMEVSLSSLTKDASTLLSTFEDLQLVNKKLNFRSNNIIVIII